MPNKNRFTSLAVTAAIAAGTGGTAILGLASPSSAAETSPAPAAPAHSPRPGGPGLAVAASTIGVSEADLLTALRSGRSIADVAQSKGVSDQKVIDALVADAKSHIEANVISGRLTRAQADAKLAELATRIKTGVERKGLPAGPHGHPGHGPGGTGGPGRGLGAPTPRPARR